MNKRIIYPTPEGGVAIIVPAPDCVLTIEEIAAKDVPAGVEYKIIDVSEVPTDRFFRNAWKINTYDKIKDVVVKINIDIFNKEKDIRYITTRTNEYKLIKQNKENLCQVA